MSSDDVFMELVQLIRRLVVTVEEMNEKLDSLIAVSSSPSKTRVSESGISSAKKEDTDLHQDRVSDVVSIIREKGAMSADELARYFNIKRSTASYYLNQAVRQGILKKFRESRTKKVLFSPIKNNKTEKKED